jgi:hypothetical protein
VRSRRLTAWTMARPSLWRKEKSDLCRDSNPDRTAHSTSLYRSQSIRSWNSMWDQVRTQTVNFVKFCYSLLAVCAWFASGSHSSLQQIMSVPLDGPRHSIPPLELSNDDFFSFSERINCMHQIFPLLRIVAYRSNARQRSRMNNCTTAVSK